MSDFYSYLFKNESSESNSIAIENDNVVMDEKGHLDFDDDRYTENTRVGYPLEFIDNALILSKKE